jgi:hypothetical protein
MEMETVGCLSSVIHVDSSLGFSVILHLVACGGGSILVMGNLAKMAVFRVITFYNLAMVLFYDL